MTSAYFEGTWQYWTPLVRFYKMTNLKWFDYYYEELKIKGIMDFLRENSIAYKWYIDQGNTIHRDYTDKYYVY